jgi:dTDP-4-dehydrorhamnose 3,5-epimerase
MEVLNTEFEGLKIIIPKKFHDSRGYFFESYNKNLLEKYDIYYDFVQDNQSKSSKNVIRGLHYQLEPKAQTKLIRVIKGEILDVVVDIRKGSPTFGKYYSLILSAENNKQLLIPKGFAHGFSVLSDSTEILYKCDEFYAPDYDGGIAYNDPSLNIDWKIPNDKVLLSEKDSKLPKLEDAKLNF